MYRNHARIWNPSQNASTRYDVVVMPPTNIAASLNIDYGSMPYYDRATRKAMSNGALYANCSNPQFPINGALVSRISMRTNGAAYAPNTSGWMRDIYYFKGHNYHPNSSTNFPGVGTAIQSESVVSMVWDVVQCKAIKWHERHDQPDFVVTQEAIDLNYPNTEYRDTDGNWSVIYAPDTRFTTYPIIAVPAVGTMHDTWDCSHRFWKIITEMKRRVVNRDYNIQPTYLGVEIPMQGTADFLYYIEHAGLYGLQLGSIASPVKDTIVELMDEPYAVLHDEGLYSGYRNGITFIPDNNGWEVYGFARPLCNFSGYTNACYHEFGYKFLLECADDKFSCQNRDLSVSGFHENNATVLEITVIDRTQDPPSLTHCDVFDAAMTFLRWHRSWTTSTFNAGDCTNCMILALAEEAVLPAVFGGNCGSASGCTIRRR